MTRREYVGLAVCVAWLAVASLVTGVLGIAGYRAGWVWVMLVLVVGTAAVSWTAVNRVTAHRGWVISFVLFGLILSARQIDTAPLSKGRLAASLDKFKLDFYKLESERTSGHSWCRPTCPSVTRVYRAPNTGPVFAKQTVASTASYYHFLPDLRAVLEARSATGFEAVGERATIRQTTVEKPGYLEVTITLTSHRGRRTKVPPPKTFR